MAFSNDESVKRIHPFEIPEIARLVAGYSESTDIVEYIKVSKEWYYGFIEHLWKDLNISRKISIPETSTLAKYAHLPTSLILDGEMPDYVLATTFPRLRKLTICGSIYSRHSFSAQFVASHHEIEDLSIQAYVEVNDYLELWESLSKLHKLKDIFISRFYVTPVCIDAFWITLSRLNSAEFITAKLPYNISPPKIPIRLKNLEMPITLTPEKNLQFFRYFTELEFLRSSAPLDFGSLTASFQQNTWSNLHRLQLPAIKLDNLSLGRLLVSIERLTNLSVDSSTWGMESFVALSCHFNTLEYLGCAQNCFSDAEGAFNTAKDSFTSVMVNTVMCSCPNLKALDARVLKGSDILENNQVAHGKQPSRQWVCTRLEFLSIEINLDGDEMQLHIMVKLSHLTQLSKLVLKKYTEVLYSPIKLSLYSGLDSLKSLRKLACVYIEGRNHSTHHMTEEDVDWIIENWKNLEELIGCIECIDGCSYCIPLCQKLEIHEITVDLERIK